MFLAPVLAMGLALPLPALADGPARTITVTGEGHVSLPPDMATVTIGVREDADSAAEALRRMSAGLAPVLDELAAAGVAAADIQTSGLSLGARYTYPDNEQPQLVGYTASSTVTVRLRDIAQVGAVLDAVVGEGANGISGISFGLADPAAATDAARRAAVADAQARAALYAEAAGVVPGAVLSISESGAMAPMPVAYAMRDAGSVPLAAGEVEVTASVTMVLAIE
ncbi:MAG: SIMPL domain-containing protein [Rubellimicrobium sp.]|nr:SIMPL domain-containing protein [Rubellimicrobium sp.]